MQHSQGVGNENQIFNVEWRLNREQKETVLVIFSAEDVVYSDVNYTHRIYFVKPNFSTWLHNLTVQEEGTYTQLIRLLNGTQLKTKMLVTVTTVLMVDSPNEVHMKVGDSLLLLGKDINESSIFNAEWMLKREGEKSSIAVFSQNFNPSTMKNFSGRVSFFNGNFSIWIHNLTVDDGGKYVQDVRLMNGKKSSHELLLTVSRPVSNVTVSSSSSCPHAGGNVTLSCEKMQGTAVTYTWHLCQKPLMEGERIILSPDNASLTLTNLQEFDVGIYRCVARTRVNEEHKDFALQLCQAERHYRSWDYYGYFGYPGYLGYFLIILFVCKKTRKVKKRNSNRGIFITTSLRSPQCLSNLS
ncbi:hypothetical protein FKM82_025364 [Ascaphus truei]